MEFGLIVVEIWNLKWLGGRGIYLGYEVFEVGDDVGVFKFLIVVEVVGDYNYSDEG